MQTSIRDTGSAKGGSRYLSLVKEEYKKGYKIPSMPYQENGIIVRELWSSKPSMVRIIPGIDPETGEILKQNTAELWSPDGPQTTYLSGSFYMCNAVFRFGESRHDIVVDLDPNSDDAARFPISPIKAFIDGIRSAVAAQTKNKKHRLKPISAWKYWTGKEGVMTYPKSTFLFQALAYQVNGRMFKHGEVDLVDEAGSPLPLLCLLGMTHRTSTANLIDALVKPSNPAMPLNAATNNMYGALAELDGNLLYLSPVADKDDNKYLSPAIKPAGQKEWIPTPMPITEEQAREWFVPWNNLLNFLTVEQQLDVLAQEFGADTVNYVLGKDRLFTDLVIPEHISSAGLGRYDTEAQASMPATRVGVSAIPSVSRPGIPAAPAAPAVPSVPARPAQAAVQAAEQAAPVRAAQTGRTSNAPTVVAPPKRATAAMVTPPAAPARPTAPARPRASSVTSAVNTAGITAELAKIKAASVPAEDDGDSRAPEDLADELLNGEADGDIEADDITQE